MVVNSYFGLRLNGPNDLTWLTRGDKSCAFFTDDPLNFLYGGITPQLPDAAWRLDLTENILLLVIDRTDVSIPNAIRVNKIGTKLYVSDTPSSPLIPGTGAYGSPSGRVQFVGSASSAIYVFDLDKHGLPSNRRIFGLVEQTGYSWTTLGEFGPQSLTGSW